MITKADIEILDTTGLEEPLILDDGRVVFGPAYMLEICDQWDVLLDAKEAIVPTDKLASLKASVEGFRQTIVRMRDQVRDDIEDRPNTYIKLANDEVVVKRKDAEACIKALESYRDSEMNSGKPYRRTPDWMFQAGRIRAALNREAKS